VADNGVGMPADFRLQNARSFGLQVVDALIQQLRADLSVDTGEGGTAFRFRWKAVSIPDIV
jgi:two-component sensor histidine kinase